MNRPKPLMKAIAKNLLIVSLVCGVPFAGWIFWVMRWYHTIEPAGPALVDHLAKRRPPDEHRVMIVDGKEYLALIGPLDPFPRIPSGPPIYIFDSAGRFVDWTGDSGDDPKFNERWPDVYRGRLITDEEVVRWPGAKR